MLTILSACGPSQPKLALKKIEDAEALLARGDTVNCLLQLDSISLLYPKALSEARSALQISNRIYVSGLMRHRENLALANTVIDSFLLKGFPPKILWFRTGNLRTDELSFVLKNQQSDILDFINSKELGCLEFSRSSL